MYLFPKITLPPRAIKEAEAKGVAADEFYCMQLLEETGFCMVAGTGFLQQPDTLHFRSTFLAPEGEIDEFISVVAAFHEGFLKEWQ